MYAPRFEPIDNNIAVMRNRVLGKNSNDNVANSDEDSTNFHSTKDSNNARSCDEDCGKYHGFKGCKNYRRASARKLLYMTVVLISLSAAIYLVKSPSLIPIPAIDFSASDKSTKIEPKGENVESTATKTKYDKGNRSNKDWSHCSDTKPNKKPVVDKKVEPLWLPNYPTSLPSILYSDFLEALTGVSRGAKSYYRSSRGLKRCHHVHNEYKVDAVTCEIVHPIIPCNRPSPSAQSANFGKGILVALRNPLTVFPAYHQSKAEAYHGQKGQVEKSNWNAFRDEWVGKDGDSTLFNEWKNFVMEWRDMEPYAVKSYVPYEYWTDELKGPLLVKKLAQVFEEEGFPVLATDEDFECLWHKHFYEPLTKEEEKHAEEGWYEPEFTKEQMELMVNGLDTFVNEIKQTFKDDKKARPGDEHLISILHHYMNTIREKM